MFVDKATVTVSAGDGGDGAVSFRTEEFVDKGGPDGGDGGRGGHVVMVADRNVNNLVKFRFKPELKGDPGKPGSKRRRHGRNGSDLVVKVPIGTVATTGSGELIADMTEHDQHVIVAKGGDGGFGNAHFKSSTRQTPRVAELGEKGDSYELILELKLLADVGLVGIPNAGKSTFLSVVTNATPEIADYAFTTLIPNLGVADIDGGSMLIADIPGLIEGASDGKGLGDEFLRHVERTAVLLHLIDVYENDVAAAYTTISNELEQYSPELVNRRHVVALTKTEGLDTDMIDEQIRKLRTVVPGDVEIFSISAAAHGGLKELLRRLLAIVTEEREATAALLAELEVDEDNLEGIPVISLPEAVKADAWKVRVEEGRYIVTGQKIERFAARTDFKNVHGIARLRDIMHKLGILHDLRRKGATGPDIVVFGEAGADQMTLEEQRQ